jgi:hypothetical protein
MSEIHKIGDIPIPIVNYVELIRNRKSPYYEIAKFISDEMIKVKEKSLEIYGNDFYSLKDYPKLSINPRQVQEEIEKRIKNDKLTSINVCRSILALLYGSQLEEEKDFHVTTTSSGRRNYHVKVSQRTLNSVGRFL